jgi:hypothetical protein
MAVKRQKVPASQQPTAAPPRRFLVRAEWFAALLVLFATAWIVTEGDWDFYKTSGHLESFYDAQAESLLHGRIDVPAAAIEGEAFTRNGKHYGYFGPTPALFRLPLVLLFPGMNGHWSRWSMLLASILTLGALLLLLRSLEELAPLAKARSWLWLKPIFILAAGIGSTEFYINAESKVYQESIQWAATLAIVSAVCLLRYLIEHRTRWLAAACVTAFLAFFARVSSGVGPVFALAVLDGALLLPYTRVRTWFGLPEIPGPRRAIALLSATVLLTAALWAGLNYWKFGVALTSQPIALNQAYDATRVRNTKGELASFHNLPLTLSTYLAPSNIVFSHLFPWIYPVHIEREVLVARFPSAHFDVCEWFVSLPAGMPALFFAALGGSIVAFGGARWRLARLPLLGAIVGCGLVFLWGLLTYRYLHDLFPWLAIGAATALASVALLDRPALRRTLAAIFVAAAAYGIWVNLSLALLQQRVYAAPVDPEKRMAFVDLAAAGAESGVRGVLSSLTGWTGYRTVATAERAMHLRLEESDAGPWQVLRPAGPPPYSVTYVMDIPADGDYELSIRYASAESRPLALTINGVNAGVTCIGATGADSEAAQQWSPSGKMRLRRGPLSIGLSSNVAFPSVTFLRLTRLD